MKTLFLKFVVSSNGKTNFLKVMAFDENDRFIKFIDCNNVFCEYMASSRFPVHPEVAEVFIKPYLEYE